MPQDEDLDTTHRLFSEVGNESYPETDISGEQWLRNKGVSDKVLAIADACYANDFGCSLHQLGLRELITENQKWDSGTTSIHALHHSPGLLFPLYVVSSCSVRQPGFCLCCFVDYGRDIVSAFLTPA